MKPFWWLFTILAIALFSCTEKGRTVQVWERWQLELKSEQIYENAYRDIVLTAEFTGPADEKFTVPGFWNGASEFIIRTAFPTPGRWHWRTMCSDSLNGGLDGQTGVVEVAAYTGDNRLYRNGFLRVSENKRYLTYHNMKPFLWVGGTAWLAPLRASAGDWKTYIDDCANKKFSVVQISPASGFRKDSVDVQGNPAFVDKSLSKWNPPYWDGFDEKVEYANEKGIVVVIVGLMEPVSRYPSAGIASTFARNLVARMSGNFVIFSPSFDSPFMELGNTVGNVIDESTSRHLVTQHPNTPYHPDTHVTAVRYYDGDYLDISMCQSGHNGGDRNWCVWKAIHWNLDLYKRGKKPVVNGEAYYESDTVDRNRPKKFLGTTRDARQLGYMSLLSGAVGYTYGAEGMWGWESDSTKGSYWKKAMQYPGSAQMKLMSEFFSGIEWWKLEPRHDLILNQSPDTVSTMTLAASKDDALLVAYLPDNDAIELDTRSLAMGLTCTWFNPVTGEYFPCEEKINYEGRQRFVRPDKGDWVLLLKK
jgi:hypothetical protein